MSKVTRSDLTLANSSATLLSLYDSVPALQNVSSTLENFLNNSKSTLVGPGFDSVRNKLNIYNEALPVVINTIDLLHDNIKAANNSMINYMGQFYSLDDSNVGDIRSKVNSLKSMINSYKSMDSNQIDWNYIAYLENVVAYFELLLSKLEGLAGADASAYGKISASLTDINNITAKINSIDINTFAAENVKVDDLLEEININAGVDSANPANMFGDYSSTGQHGIDLSTLKNAMKDKYGENSEEYKELLATIERIEAYGYSQKDAQWANLACRGSNYANSGCQPTSMAVICSYLTGKEIYPTDVYNYNSSTSVEGLKQKYNINSYYIKKIQSEWNQVLDRGGCIMGISETAGGAYNDAHAIAIMKRIPNYFGPGVDGYMIHDSFWPNNDLKVWTWEQILPPGSSDAYAFENAGTSNLQTT